MIKHYRKIKNQKKLTLFSKDAVKSVDESGKRYDKYTWNNLNMNFVNDITKMSISMLDFKTYYEIYQANTVVRYNFEDGFDDISSNKYDAINVGNVPIERNIVKNGIGSVRFNKTAGQGLFIDQNSNKLYSHLYENMNGITIGFWYRAVSGGNNGLGLGRIFSGADNTDVVNNTQNSMIQFYHNSSNTTVNFAIARGGASRNFSSSVTLNTWHHFLWVIQPSGNAFSGTDHTWRIYKDGVLVSNTNNKTYPIFSTDYYFSIGKWCLGFFGGDERELDGYVDDFFILNKALSTTEATTLFSYLHIPEPIFTIKSDDVIDVFNTDNKSALIFHNRGYISSRKKLHPSFKMYSPLNQLSLYFGKYTDSTFTSLGLEDRDQFVITLIFEDDDNKEYNENNIIEAYSHIPQLRIKY